MVQSCTLFWRITLSRNDLLHPAVSGRSKHVPWGQPPTNDCIICVCAICSVVFNSLRPHGLARQAPLSIEFSRQECWSRLPFPPPGILPNLGIQHVSLASPSLAGGFFTTAHLGNQWLHNAGTKIWSPFFEVGQLCGSIHALELPRDRVRLLMGPDLPWLLSLPFPASLSPLKISPESTFETNPLQINVTI